MIEFRLILIFEESKNYVADNKFLVWIYTSNWKHMHVYMWHPQMGVSIH